MKKIFTLIMATALTVSAMAVTVSQVTGTFRGDLNIAGDVYSNKEVYVLPGVESNTITFVLPDFTYGKLNLGDIVLANIPMDETGKLSLEEPASLYLPAIQERAAITVLNDLEDAGNVYGSTLGASSLMVVLSIKAPSVSSNIFVLYMGNRVTENYAINNGGFEGTWSNNEVSGWHSFGTAAGGYASSVSDNTDQFTQSTEKRPGTTGTYSAHLQSKMILGAVKANGNCTNGRVNAGSMDANDAEGNYNYSDPNETGYNTPFVGTPDSLVFWAKYIPADQNPDNEVNQARVNAVITTNARYQDPESTEAHENARIAQATLNYKAKDMDWQRISVPFEYSEVDPAKAAYVLITFSTNYQPAGGTTSSGGSIFGGGGGKVDNLYLDDAEMIYNYGLKSFTMNGAAITFKASGKASTKTVYNDSTITFAATTSGRTDKSIIAFDGNKRQVYVYILPQNYSQQQDYEVYTLQMAAPPKTTYKYTVDVCDNEYPYSDNLFSNIEQAGSYKTTIRNTQGGDSIVTLVVTSLPTYNVTDSKTITEGAEETWAGYDLSTYAQGVHELTGELQTVAGCDSTVVMTLTVDPKTTTALPTTNTKRVAQKVVNNGNLYIIREDEVVYDILGQKVK